MWIKVCYHRMRIRVKLTCYKIGGSVGAVDECVACRTTLASAKPLVRFTKRADIPAYTGRLTYTAKT